MKKKIFSTLLMGAFFLASMSMFTSCKDYDDDINDLRNLIEKNASTLTQEPIMQEIVDRYPSANDFLFPIIKDEGKKARSQYRNMLCKVNKQLVEIGNLIHTDVKLTMYVARHSWASIALKLNIPVELISRGMGHDSEKTTRIYLKSLYNSQLDEANRQVMEALSLFSKPPID